MKKRVFFLSVSILLILFVSNLFAKKITGDIAQQIAKNWIHYQHSYNSVKDYKKLIYNNKVIAYLFDLKPRGYIVVPADDILPPIKTYSFHNNYIIHGQGFYDLLEKELYSLIFSNNFSGNVFENNRKIWDKILTGNYFASYSEKSLNLTTSWDQSPYYNSEMPSCSNCSSGNGYYLVGCNAVALGQIMKYYKWPDTGRDYFSYTDTESGLSLSVNFKNGSYNWDLMPDYLDATSSQNEIYEVAHLLFDVAVSIQSKLKYDSTSASSFDSSDALYKFFRYYPSQYILRKDYSSDTDWFNVFKTEINSDRPVLFGLSSSSIGGHAVVLYGYKEDGNMKQVHLNMGWGGADNNWYTLNNIVTTNYTFDDVMGQDAIVNIKKDSLSDVLYYHDSRDQVYAYNTFGYNTPSSYGAVKFLSTVNGYVSHISFYLVQRNMSYEVSLYSGSSFDNAINSSPLFTVTGSSDKTGWHYVEPTSDIPVSSGTNYYAVVKFTGNSAYNGYYLVLPTDVDGSGTGYSYVGWSKTSMQQYNDGDVLIRMAVKTSASQTESCSSSNYSLCTTESDCEGVGGYWYNNQCNSSQQEVCDSSHLNLCNSQTNCTEAGGYWYNNKCNAEPNSGGGSSTSSCSSAANPSSALNSVEYKSGVTQPNPTDNIITVGTSSSIYLQPSLNVASGDVGQSAVLVLYVYLKDFYTGIMMPTKSVTLSSVQKFTNLPNALNFSDASGMDFYVYYGYRIGSTLKYNVYEVKVTSSCSSMPDCSQYSDESSCKAVEGCTVSTNFFGSFDECILNCAQYTSQNSCQNAFDGNSCSWNSTFATCDVK